MRNVELRLGERIVVHVEHLAGVMVAKQPSAPVGGMLDFLGVESEDLIEARESRGLRVDGNDLVLSPTRMLPPPETRGRVTELRVGDDGMVLIFGPGAGGAENRPDGAATEDAGAGNYLLYRGGTTRIGRMTMTDTDIKMTDATPEDPFGFDIDRIQDQLVAGHIELTPDGGLRPVTPDFQDLPQTTSGSTSGAR